MQTLTRSVIVLLLSASTLSPSPTERVSYCPIASRVIQVNFFVDNNHYLARKALEVIVKEDRFQKKLVPISREYATLRGLGASDLLVPEGPIHLSVCGVVSCPRREEELFCGEVEIPDWIAVDRVHEVTLSTNHACLNASDIAAKVPLVDGH